MAMTKAEKRRQRKAERESERDAHEKRRMGKDRRTNFAWILLGVAVVAIMTYLIYSGLTKESFTEGAVHWHATLAFDICGEREEPPVVPVDDHLLHTHDDRLIHVEGKVWDMEQITLGRYMEQLHLPFGDGRLMGYQDGGTCPTGTPQAGSVGTVWVTVDGQRIGNYTAHVIRDRQEIVIGFGT